MEDKENVAPARSSDLLLQKSAGASPKKASRKGRSKSIGPGGLDEAESTKAQAKQDAKNRRKSTFVQTTKSIISSDIEKAQRQAARRKTLANRRVSFAPEATLHTWDVVEFMRDPTTSTDSSESTRRASNITRSSNDGSPHKGSHALGSDPPSTPPEQADESEVLPEEPAHQRNLHQKKRRRSSGQSTEDAFSSPSVVSGSSDVGESDDEGDEFSDDDGDTAMSLDAGGENTSQSLGESEASSTGSSARLEAALRQASQAAGTRGIEYDEYGDASTELAIEDIATVTQPSADQQLESEAVHSASLDQENINPFSPAFKAEMISGHVSRPCTVYEEDTGDFSMDITRAVGGLVRSEVMQPRSSPVDDATMDFTQAVGKIQSSHPAKNLATSNTQKRRRSTTEDGSPGAVVSATISKRRRSSVARSSMGDDAMDLTIALGSIQDVTSPVRTDRRKSTAERRSSSVVSNQDDTTMDFTQAVGKINPASCNENTASSFDENEELTMELTTVLGGIKAASHAANESRPRTPQNHSPVRPAANTTPKDQERFKDAPDSGPKKLLTPMFQKQVNHDTDKTSSVKAQKSNLSAVRTNQASPGPSLNDTSAIDHEVAGVDAELSSAVPTRAPSPIKQTGFAGTPPLGDHKSPLRASPFRSPGRTRNAATPDSTVRLQLDAQLQDPEPSPSVQKQLRSSPARAPATPQNAADNQESQERCRMADSIKLMSTPRKEVLKTATPKKSTPAKVATPKTAPSSKTQLTPRSKTATRGSPLRQLGEDMARKPLNDRTSEKVQLQNFLDLAGIRFMDLTTTKRRMTHATTPSKARKAAGELQTQPDEAEVDLTSAIIAGGCTLPELEMYEHACHELKRYIADGKKVIKELEVETAQETPPLLQAYMAAAPHRKATLDAQMRDIKTHARYRSKEMWYGWRAQLLEDLRKGLQGIGEGLIKDDEVLHRQEEILDQVLPNLVERHDSLQAEAEKLEQEDATVNEEDQEELESARSKLQTTEEEIRHKQEILNSLQQDMSEQTTLANDLEETRDEFAAAIAEADRVKESCRLVSTDEIAKLEASVRSLTQTHNWTITAATSSPLTVTMNYAHQLQLLFQPTAFADPNNPNNNSKTDSHLPLSLKSLTAEPDSELPTTHRFFLQSLRYTLHSVPQDSTPISHLLNTISSTWLTAQNISETERRLSLSFPTTTRILSDERLAVEATFLVPAVRTKVRVSFEVVAAVIVGTQGPATSVECKAEVVYGEPFDEAKMRRVLEKEVAGKLEGWDLAVEGLRGKLLARGTKKSS